MATKNKIKKVSREKFPIGGEIIPGTEDPKKKRDLFSQLTSKELGRFANFTGGDDYTNSVGEGSNVEDYIKKLDSYGLKDVSQGYTPYQENPTTATQYENQVGNMPKHWLGSMTSNFILAARKLNMPAEAFSSNLGELKRRVGVDNTKFGNIINDPNFDRLYPNFYQTAGKVYGDRLKNFKTDPELGPRPLRDETNPIPITEQSKLFAEGGDIDGQEDPRNPRIIRRADNTRVSGRNPAFDKMFYPQAPTQAPTQEPIEESAFDIDNYESKIKSYASRSVFKGKPMANLVDHAREIAEIAAKVNKKYGVAPSPELLLSQAQFETGTTNLKSKNNYWNVGNNNADSIRNYKSIGEAVEGYMDLLARNYFQKGKVSEDDLLNNFINKDGDRYQVSDKDPTSRKYEGDLKEQMKVMKKFFSKKRDGIPQIQNNPDSVPGRKLALGDSIPGDDFRQYQRSTIDDPEISNWWEQENSSQGNPLVPGVDASFSGPGSAEDMQANTDFLKANPGAEYTHVDNLSGSGAFPGGWGSADPKMDTDPKKSSWFNKNKIDIEKTSALGMTLLNSYLGRAESAKVNAVNRRRAIDASMRADSVPSPFLNGNGSQAIMAEGGVIDGEDEGLEITDGGYAKMISQSDHSSPMMEYHGRSHDEKGPDGNTGIGINYQGNQAEVEDKEVGWVDNKGSLNIFGKLKVPGSNKTFKTMAKDIAKKEMKIDKKKSLYTNTLNNLVDATPDGYTKSAISTAKVMFKSLDKQSKEVAETKEGMSSFQNLMLAVKTDNEKRAVVPQFAAGGAIGPGDIEDVAAIQKYIDQNSGGKSPLTAQDYIDVSKKYGVPIELLLAQGRLEANFGTKGKSVRTKNIGNVGNDDAGHLKYMNSWKQGLEAHAKLIRDDYAKDPNNVSTQEILDNGFVRPRKGGAYAPDDYAGRIRTIVNGIRKASGKEPYLKPNSPGNKIVVDRNGFDSPVPPYSMPFSLHRENKRESFVPQGGLHWGTPSGPIDDLTIPFAGPNSMTDQEANDDFLKSNPNSVHTPGEVTTLPGGRDDTFPMPPTVIMDGERPVVVPGSQQSQQKQNVFDNFSDALPDTPRGIQSPLNLSQIAPELIQLATNQQEAVPSLSYHPELKQTYDISMQGARNDNQSTFNTLSKIAESTGNIDALTQMAAQKYKADEAVNTQEYNANVTQKANVYGQNVDTLNQAEQVNIQMADRQQEKQAMARFNTKKQFNDAFGSIVAKTQQNTLENKTYNAYANLFMKYGFDKDGNVTFDSSKKIRDFTPSQAAQYGVIAAKDGIDAVTGQKTSTVMDKDGNIKAITKIEDDLKEYTSVTNSKMPKLDQDKYLQKSGNSVYKTINGN